MSRMNRLTGATDDDVSTILFGRQEWTDVNGRFQSFFMFFLHFFFGPWFLSMFQSFGILSGQGIVDEPQVCDEQGECGENEVERGHAVGCVRTIEDCIGWELRRGGYE